MMSLQRVICVLIGLIVLAVAKSATAETVVLYEPERGTTPDQQGWAYVTKPLLVAKAKRSFSDGVTRLDTMPVMQEWVGFLSRVNLRGFDFRHPEMPDLNRATGYTVRFRICVLEEAHTGKDRAGFCIIVVGNDLQAIELDFWSGEIWAQSGPKPGRPDEPLFTHSVERSAFDTTQDCVYQLHVFGDRYRLEALGKEVLEGPLRDYSSHWHPSYGQANTIFLGDNSSRGSAVVELGRVEVLTNAGRTPQ